MTQGRFFILCLCLATALKPVRQTAAVRPRARAPVAKASILGVPTVPRGGGRPNVVVVRLLSLGQIMNLDVIQTKWLRGVFLATDLAVYIWTFCKAWHRRLEHDIFEPKSGFLTWSVLAYWAYALKQIYLAGGRAAMLSKEALGPAACAIAGYFLLANLPELTGV